MIRSTFFILLIGMLLIAASVRGFFIQINHRSNADLSQFNQPLLSGPDRLCNVFGSILADYSGGGNPATDVYKWKIYNPANVLVFDRGGGALFETITYTFSGSGSFRIELIVERGGIQIYAESMNVQVVLGPKINLKSSYSFCEGGDVTLQAIDPSSPNFSDYKFEWRNSSNTVIGTGNEITLNNVDQLSVNFFFLNALGDRECDTQLQTETKKIADYTISSSSSSICPEEIFELKTTPPTLGTWSYLKSGISTPVEIGYGASFQVSPGQDLNGPGTYNLIFTPDPNKNPSCLAVKTLSLDFFPQPEFIVYPSTKATDCTTFDGELTIEAITDLDFIRIDSLGLITPSILAGAVYVITGLKSNTYTLTGVLGSCSNNVGTLVPLENPPLQLAFSIEDIQSEVCTPTGKTQGSFSIKFGNPPTTGTYRIINKKGQVVQELSFKDATEIPITISGGDYFIEIFDDLNCNNPSADEVNVPALTQTTFNIPEELTICQSFEFTPTTSQALAFTITYPDGTQESKPAGTPFSLTQNGEHKILGILPGQSLVCPTEKILDVILVDPIQFEPVLINQDCFGNRTYEANIFGRDPSTVIFRWFNENDDLVGTGQFLNPVSNGIFKLDVQPSNSESCPNPPLEFEIKEPVLAVEVTLEATKLCEYGPRAIVELSTTFPEEVTDIEWRRYDDLGNIEVLDQFENKNQIIADLPGIYEASVYSRIPSINKNCELGRSTIELDLILDKVTYDVPSQLSICDPFELIPNSPNPLEFELIFPDGKVEIKNWNQAFTLDQEGTYTILGYETDIKGPLCPEQKTIEVTFFEPVIFSPEEINLSCSGEYQYLADVQNYPPDQVDYFWKDPSGNLVGNNQILTTSTYGAFTLEVQPKGSLPCQKQEIPFDIPVPELNIPVSIEAETLCPDQVDAALTLIAEIEPTDEIEWWYTDLSNNQRELTNFKNKVEILAIEEGTYEVRVLNLYGCLLGLDQKLIVRSTDQVRPDLEEFYQVCPDLEIGPNLNPGNFSIYEWYFGDRLVSNSAIFKPNEVGIYTLIVYSNEGCAYTTSFETMEECELKVAFPTAIQPGNPEKEFLIYSNYLIDELEVWILNKWGNEVFHCRNVELLQNVPTCIWDGFYKGEKVIPGTYAVKISYRNIEKNIREEQIGGILVID